jgi:serine/threonine protein kinase
VIFRELIQGLSHIHGMEIFYRAFAPPNILFSDTGNLVICMSLSQWKHVAEFCYLLAANFAEAQSSLNFQADFLGLSRCLAQILNHLSIDPELEIPESGSMELIEFCTNLVAGDLVNSKSLLEVNFLFSW